MPYLSHDFTYLTKRFGIPQLREGRNGYKPEAIMLHRLGIPTDTYLNDVKVNLAYNLVRAQHASIHTIISRDGMQHHLIKPDNVAWGVWTLHYPTWSKLIVDANDHNQYLLHIGFESMNPIAPHALKSCAELMATLATQYNIPLDNEHIIGHWILEKTCVECFRDSDGMLPTLIIAANVARQNTGLMLTPSLKQLEARVLQLEAKARG